VLPTEFPCQIRFWFAPPRSSVLSHLPPGKVARKLVLHVKWCRSMKTNVTLKIEADLLREVRILAAEEGTSISALLAARLQQAVQQRKR